MAGGSAYTLLTKRLTQLFNGKEKTCLMVQIGKLFKHSMSINVAIDTNKQTVFIKDSF